MRFSFLFVLIFSLPVFAQEKIKLSDDLEILPIDEHTFIHISYMYFEGFGKVASNGLIFVHNQEALIADTPTSNQQSEDLLDWLAAQHIQVKAVIPTHFHDDCLGGLHAFHSRGIPSYSSALTKKLAQQHSVEIPQHTFVDSLTLSLSGLPVELRYFGEGHTRDNFTLWIPAKKLLFGGCLVKTLGAGKGNLSDANPIDWPASVQRVKTRYPDVKVVVPGHGAYGDQGLLTYTIQLFSN